jgi:hypothetical protein
VESLHVSKGMTVKQSGGIVTEMLAEYGGLGSVEE